MVWDDPVDLPVGIQRITRDQLAVAYGEGFVGNQRNVVYDREVIHRARPLLFAELYGAGPETLNRIVHQGDFIDIEAYAQLPATAEVNRNGQS